MTQSDKLTATEANRHQVQKGRNTDANTDTHTLSKTSVRFAHAAFEKSEKAQDGMHPKDGLEEKVKRESDDDNADGNVGQHPTYPEGSSSLVSDSNSAKGSVDVQRTEVCRGKEKCRRREGAQTELWRRKWCEVTCSALIGRTEKVRQRSSEARAGF